VSVAPPPAVVAGVVAVPPYPPDCDELNSGTFPPPAGIKVEPDGAGAGDTSGVLLQPTASAMATAAIQSDEPRCIKLPPGRLDVCLVQHSIPSGRETS
jgi:hypothetical protein